MGRNDFMGNINGPAFSVRYHLRHIESFNLEEPQNVTEYGCFFLCPASRIETATEFFFVCPRMK